MSRSNTGKVDSLPEDSNQEQRVEFEPVPIYAPPGECMRLFSLADSGLNPPAKARNASEDNQLPYAFPFTAIDYMLR